MSDYWIKLYIEILEDSKMAVLPDRLWRRVIELFLLAGRMHNDGRLPDTSELAWILRMQTDDLSLDLQQIAATGIIERTVNGWTVPKFAQRQAPAQPRERMQAMRNRQHQEQYYGDVTKNVTQVLPIVTQRTDTDTDTDTDTEAERAPDPFAAMQSLVQETIGCPMTQRDIPAINEFIQLGVIQQDIRDALGFLQSVDKSPRGAADMVGSVRTAFRKRTQARNKSPGGGVTLSEYFAQEAAKNGNASGSP